MLYKFKSKAAGDVIMSGPVGDAVLRAMGREPASQGIFESAALSSLVAVLERSIAEDEAVVRPGADGASESDDAASGMGLRLRQRAWPLMEMMKKSLAGQADIVWGV